MVCTKYVGMVGFHGDFGRETVMARLRAFSSTLHTSLVFESLTPCRRTLYLQYGMVLVPVHAYAPAPRGERLTFRVYPESKNIIRFEKEAL